MVRKVNHQGDSDLLFKGHFTIDAAFVEAGLPKVLSGITRFLLAISYIIVILRIGYSSVSYFTFTIVAKADQFYGDYVWHRLDVKYALFSRKVDPAEGYSPQWKSSGKAKDSSRTCLGTMYSGPKRRK